jgi:hypothetical protein
MLDKPLSELSQFHDAMWSGQEVGSVVLAIASCAE